MIRFIKNLVSKKIIKLVEPSDEICESYLLKSDTSLISSKTLFSIGNFDDAIVLIYYSMYYSVMALFFKCGIKVENHTALIFLLYDLFKIDTDDIKFAKQERIDKQYYVDVTATKLDVQRGISRAEDFCSIILEKIDFINLAKINEIRRIFRNKYLS